ncbi:MAG: RDD family protein [Chloroflexi bacterium]|nr:RDD family protein [Chloroflexota bacterium]
MTTPAPSWPTPPEIAGPAPGVRFAGNGARLGAYLLDVILIGAIVSLFVVLLAVPLAGDALRIAIVDPGRFQDPATWTELGGSIVLFVAGTTIISLLALLYFPFFWARGGQTPGMRVAGIRVVNDRDGSRIGWGAAILRLIGYWISGAVFYLGFIWILVDARRRGWHDLIAGTCVIAVR